MTPTMEEVAGWLREAAGIFEISYQSGPGHDFWKRSQKLYESRAAQVEAMGWRPIEDAPEPGTVVLISGHIKNDNNLAMWVRQAVQEVESGRWFSPDDEEFEGDSFWPPTHFMPTPQPPVKK